MNFAQRLKKERTDRDISQTDLGKILNLSKQTISSYENGGSFPGQETLNKIANYFNVSIDYLMGRSDIKSPSSPAKKTRGIKIPVLGKVAAGIPIEAIEDIEDYEEITEEMASKGEYFALRIKGESMEPRFTDGDVVIVRRQEDVESGEIGVVIVNGADATVKKVMKQENGILLLATNQGVYPPKFYDNETIETLPVKILGRVVELRAKF